MNIVILDRLTLGEDLDISGASALGTVTVYDNTAPHQVEERIRDAEVIYLNKVKLGEGNLQNAQKLRLICVAATGYDNIDVAWCRQKGIAVCNVPGYSVYSVAQLTVSMALYLVSHLPAYTRFTASGEYTKSGTANRLTPIYHELYGKTWGIVGYGSIGAKVGEIARALGCSVLAYKRTPAEGVPCTDLNTLMEKSDIISVHLPLSAETRGIINEERIAKMKKSAILINTARGAVTDEAALCRALTEGRIAALGTDVYSVEPFGEDSPFYAIKDYENVCLTPHMAWGTVEARARCFAEMLENTAAFYRGELRNRIE